MKFLLDISVLIVSFFLMWKFKTQITDYLFKKASFSGYKLSLLVSIPLILIEESINTNDHGLIISLVIIFILIVQMALLLWLSSVFKVSSVKWPLLVYMIFGTSWELTIGGLTGIFAQPLPFAIFMVFFYVPLSYAYFALIPLNLLTYKEQTKLTK